MTVIIAYISREYIGIEYSSITYRREYSHLPYAVLTERVKTK